MWKGHNSYVREDIGIMPEISHGTPLFGTATGTYQE